MYISLLVDGFPDRGLGMDVPVCPLEFVRPTCLTHPTPRQMKVREAPLDLDTV